MSRDHDVEKVLRREAVLFLQRLEIVTYESASFGKFLHGVQRFVERGPLGKKILRAFDGVFLILGKRERHALPYDHGKTVAFRGVGDLFARGKPDDGLFVRT